MFSILPEQENYYGPLSLELKADAPLPSSFYWEINGQRLYDNIECVEHDFNQGYYTIGLCKCIDGEIACDSTTLCINPCVDNKVNFRAIPDQLYVSNDYLFSVCVSSNCPPPLTVNLYLSGSNSCSIEDVEQNTWTHLIPTYEFKDLKGNTLPNNFELTIDDVDPIYKDNQVVGFSGCECFLFRDDYPNKNLKLFASLDVNSCGVCDKNSVFSNRVAVIYGPECDEDLYLMWEFYRKQFNLNGSNDPLYDFF